MYILQYGEESKVDKETWDPRLKDSNGEPLALSEVVSIKDRLGKTVYRINLIIEGRLSW